MEDALSFYRFLCSQWHTVALALPSFHSLRCVLYAGWLSFLLGSLVFSLLSKNEQKPCWSFKLQRCILSFSLNSSEEVQALLRVVCCSWSSLSFGILRVPRPCLVTEICSVSTFKPADSKVDLHSFLVFKLCWLRTLVGVL